MSNTEDYLDEILNSIEDIKDVETAETVPQEDEGFLDSFEHGVLSEGDADGEKAADAGEGFSGDGIDFVAEKDDQELKNGKEKKHKKETEGFLKKISRVLFGEEEEEVLEEEKVPEIASEPDADGISDENLLLLQQLEGTGAEETENKPQKEQETPEEAKARKKLEKDEEKARKKAERAEKAAKRAKQRAAVKAKKLEEKRRRPQEPDSAPPLPKKPVILSFIMAGSFLVLVLLGTNLFGYSSSMTNAKRAFEQGNYEEAYQQVSGLEIKEKDYETYQKYRVMGIVAGEYHTYQTFMEAEIYDMALDSLIRAVGRCQKYQPDAETYGCASELAKLKEQAENALGGFGITGERASELYALEERSEYSTEIYQILEEGGYMVD